MILHRYRRNADADLRELERRARAGDREATDALHYELLRVGRPRDYTPEALSILDALEIGDPVPPWVPGELRDYGQGEWRAAGASGLGGRFLVLQNSVMFASNNLWAHTVQRESEVPELLAREGTLEYPDTLPWFALLVADLLFMEPFDFRYCSQIRGRGSPLLGCGEWLGKRPKSNPDVDLRELERRAAQGDWEAAERLVVRKIRAGELGRADAPMAVEVATRAHRRGDRETRTRIDLELLRAGLLPFGGTRERDFTIERLRSVAEAHLGGMPGIRAYVDTLDPPIHGLGGSLHRGSEARGERKYAWAELVSRIQIDLHPELVEGRVSAGYENVPGHPVGHLDAARVGTPLYSGYGSFWNHEYRHPLREFEPYRRKRLHDLLLAHSLQLVGISPAHAYLIHKAANQRQTLYFPLAQRRWPAPAKKAWEWLVVESKAAGIPVEATVARIARGTGLTRMEAEEATRFLLREQRRRRRGETDLHHTSGRGNVPWLFEPVVYEDKRALREKRRTPRYSPVPVLAGRIW